MNEASSEMEVIAIWANWCKLPGWKKKKKKTAIQGAGFTHPHTR